MSPSAPNAPRVAVIGGGPAGLMAAEVISAAGVAVEVFERMPTVGRKLLMAGRGGLNITHSEAATAFVARYGTQAARVGEWLSGFGPADIRAWMSDLGIESFVGSSGKVFPVGMKAAPLLRAWLARLRAAGVMVHVRHRWVGWTADGALRFETPAGPRELAADAVVLALGGGSWARLGSDGTWWPLLEAAGVPLAPLAPSNCGFEIGWSEVFRERFAGAPLKTVALSFDDAQGMPVARRGECLVTRHGLQGPLIYALSAPLREALAARGEVRIALDLLPDREHAAILAALSRPRGSRSLSSHLRRSVGIDGVKAALLREVLDAAALADVQRVTDTIKALPLGVTAPRPLDEAISTAGGVRLEGLDEALMLRALPGVFCAGEMLDWEAPTGGYLLSACLSGGRVAGYGVLRRLAETGGEVQRGNVDGI